MRPFFSVAMILGASSQKGKPAWFFMNANKFGGRQLKKIVRECLKEANFEKGLAIINDLPPRQAVNPLFSAFCSLDDTVKWRAVAAMGSVVANLAEIDLESARVVMRRFIWNLNDESGGIGWGCPEAMGEIMALNTTLADEYWCLLTAYIQPDGNYLEHPVLQRGVVWAVGRLAHARPRLICSSAHFLFPYMTAEDANLRGLAAWAVAPFEDPRAKPFLERISGDHSVFELFKEGQLVKEKVSRMAKQALKSITSQLRH